MATYLCRVCNSTCTKEPAKSKDPTDNKRGLGHWHCNNCGGKVKVKASHAKENKQQ